MALYVPVFIICTEKPPDPPVSLAGFVDTFSLSQSPGLSEPAGRQLWVVANVREDDPQRVPRVLAVELTLAAPGGAPALIAEDELEIPNHGGGWWILDLPMLFPLLGPYVFRLRAKTESGSDALGCYSLLVDLAGEARSGLN